MCSLHIDVLVVAETMKMMMKMIAADLLLSLLSVEVLQVRHKNNVLLHTPLVDNVKYMDNADIQLS